MWRPSKYDEHNASLAKWAAAFNLAVPVEIVARPFQDELFIHDGTIDLWGACVRFDWEKRQDWVGPKFPFATVGQFDRKFMAEKQIDLALMCNSGETHFLAAWHRDFQARVLVNRKTDFAGDELGHMRLADSFRVLAWQPHDLVAFKRWLLNTYRQGRPADPYHVRGDC